MFMETERHFGCYQKGGGAVSAILVRYGRLEASTIKNNELSQKQPLQKDGVFPLTAFPVK